MHMTRKPIWTAVCSWRYNTSLAHAATSCGAGFAALICNGAVLILSHSRAAPETRGDTLSHTSAW